MAAMPSRDSRRPTGDRDRVVAQAQRARQERERSYREQALKLFPWICGRCAREFTRENLRELTVHHRDHDHDNNPPNGSNWELLCIYCHDNEHARSVDPSGSADPAPDRATHRPFGSLDSLLKRDK